jgi:hypothetical protein
MAWTGLQLAAHSAGFHVSFQAPHRQARGGVGLDQLRCETLQAINSDCLPCNLPEYATGLPHSPGYWSL